MKTTITRIGNGCNRRLARAALLLALIVGTTVFTNGQTATATLSGTVEDERGAVVPGAAVSVVNAGTAIKREAVTNGEGYFVIPLLSPGSYTVRAEHSGFMIAEINNIVLNVGDQKALRIPLKTGDIKETVNITGEAPLINESPAVGTVVDRQFVQNIPVNGRSFQALIALTPGTVLTKSTFSEQGQFSINGQRPDANYFTIDGVGANFGVSGSGGANQAPSGVLPGLSAAGSSNNLVSMDALQEFKVLSSTFAPEFGRSPGGQVQIVTRSGTNSFHGAVFEYLRNDALDASDWFVNANRLKKPALRQNDFGFVLGGPVLLPRFGEGGHQPGYNGHNRTFLFFSFEGQRLRLPQVKTTDVPSLLARQTAAAGIQPYLNAYPLPNGTVNAVTNFAQFTAGYSDPSSLTATSIRIDQIISSRLTLFGRYNYAPSESTTHGGNGGNSLNTLSDTNLRTQTLTIGSTQTLTAKDSNDLVVNYSRNVGKNFFFLDSFGGAVIPTNSLLFPSFTSSRDGFFTFTITGGLGSSYSAGSNSDNLQRQINIVDNFVVTAGSHQIKLGVDYRRLSPIIRPTAYFLGPSFSGVNQAITGRATSISVFSFGGSRLLEITNLSTYAQDTWRISRRLLLTYGLRWEVNPSPRDNSATPALTVLGVDNPATFSLAPKGTRLYKNTYNNFAPRVGASYQLFEKPGREMVLRGGFGVFYDTGLGAATLGSSGSAFPYSQSRLLPANTPFPVTDPSLVAPPIPNLNPPFGALFAADQNLKLPYTLEWNFAVEQSLGNNQVLTASYVGAAGRRLLRLVKYQPPVISSNFTTVTVAKNLDTSDYNALQFQFKRRLSRRLQALASYVWSHSIDTASSDGALNPPDAKLSAQSDRGSSDFDVRHAVSAAVTYDLPKSGAGSIGSVIFGGFSLDAIFTARSATPVNILSSRNIGFGTFAFRPDLVPGVPLYLADSLAPGGRRFNPAAFDRTTPAAANRQGTLGRNVLRGFPISQLDFAIRRQFKLTEEVKFQFGAELFNIFNHPNFADPVGILTSSSFGRSISMLRNSLGSGGLNGGLNPLFQIGGPRSIQLTGRITF